MTHAPRPAGPSRLPEGPFHAGEIEAQTRAGVRPRAIALSSMFRDHLPEQHRAFFAQLPMLVVGSLDAMQRPWASVLVGAPGFIDSPDARTLRVAALPAPGDPLHAQLAPGASLGLLGIELHTRRRNRLNGRVLEVGANGFGLRVVQSFGNCPRYIQSRLAPSTPNAPRAASSEALGPRLDAEAMALIEQADTLFVASANARGDGSVDVSHRGGPPGFARLEDRAGGLQITLPDFPGNNAFNTIGNLLAHPHAGLAFIDFEQGHLLQLSGRAEVLWRGPEVEAVEGARRLVRILVEAGFWQRGTLPADWSAPDFAPQFIVTPALG